MNDEQRIQNLAAQIREHGGVRINIESFSSSRAMVEAEKKILQAAAKEAGVEVEIENVSNYFLRARTK